jgi:glycosyltransferase involved in cell wall biosynthesis
MADSSDVPPKKNLLIVAASLGIGGAETVIRHLANQVDRSKFNVIVGCLKPKGPIADELEREGVEVLAISNSAKPDYFSFRKLLRVIRQRRVDVVHTHTTHGLVDATICKLLMPRLRVLHTFHFGNYPHTRKSIIWMERFFGRLADRLFAVGEVQRGQIRKLYGFRDRAIRVIFNGVLLKQTTGDADFRSRIGAAEDTVLIGTIATLIPQKGLPDLVRVARRVVDAGHRARFVIVGEGVMREELEALRRELHLEDDVVLTGWVTNAAETAMPTFDIFFQPSLWEAMSVVILEAMAAKRAVVATRVGENPHVITHDVDGLLVNAADIDGMAAALGRLITDADLRRRLGEAARQTIEDRFTVQHMARAYEAVYLER